MTLSETDWERAVKDAFKNWHRIAELSKSPLIDLDGVKRKASSPPFAHDLYGQAKALKEVLRTTIDALGVEGEEPPQAPEDPRWLDLRWRYYALLKLRYLEAWPRGVIQARIGLAEGGQFYSEQKTAIEYVATMLRELDGRPSEEISPLGLSYPSGAIALTDKFYIERKADQDIRSEMVTPNITATIRGPRQVGKTSLLIRAANLAREQHGTKIAYLDLQAIGWDSLESLDSFLRQVAEWLVDELGLDHTLVEASWHGKQRATMKLTNLINRHVLVDPDIPVLLAMDEVDLLLHTDFHSEFFGLVRSWHNRRAHDPRWNNLGILMAISTEPYLLIDDMKQSPFNVGLTLYLDDFGQAEVHILNRLYGSLLTDHEVAALFTLLNGHPFLTRVAFYTMRKEGLSWAAFSTITDDENGPFSGHLRHQLTLLNNDPVLKQALSEVIHHRYCSDELACFRLLKAGLIKRHGGGYKSRCELYRSYFSDRI